MQACALTDVGKLRTTNQDYIFSSTNPIGALDNLFMVADGMGGHQAGDYASRFVVENLSAYAESSMNQMPIAILRNGIKWANERLYHRSLKEEHLKGMGTTLVAASIENSTLYVANVGDSRLYLIRDGITQITRDHSYVEELVLMGKMERNSQDYQDKKNIITRAIGTNEEVEADFFEISLQEGDLILLCSDGLTNMVSEDEIEGIIMTEGSLCDKTRRLIEAANHYGGRDNIAVILVEPQISEVRAC